MPPSMLTVDFFAEAYGWPPEVSRRLSLPDLHWLPIVRQARARADKIRSDQNRGPQGGR